MAEFEHDPAGSLIDKIKNMNADEGVKMIRELCASLGSDAESFHGNIWPGNVRLDWEGKAVLGAPSDVPAAKREPEQAEYLAPEFFWEGQKSAAADVYSLALLLYAACSRGYLPFQPRGGAMTNKDRSNALRRRMKGSAITPPSNVSPELRAILKKALAYDPEARYISAAEFLAALNETDEALPSASEQAVTEQEELSGSVPPAETEPAEAESPEEATVSEPEPEAGATPEDLPADEGIPAAPDLPEYDGVPFIDLPENDSVLAEDAPEDGEAFGADDLPGEEDVPAADGLGGGEESFAAEDLPADEDALEADDLPGEEDSFKVDEQPEEEPAPVAEDMPAEETVPAEEDLPADEEVSEQEDPQEEAPEEESASEEEPRKYTVNKDVRRRSARKNRASVPEVNRKKKSSPLIPLLCIAAIAVIVIAVILIRGGFPAKPAEEVSEPYTIEPTPHQTPEPTEAPQPIDEEETLPEAAASSEEPEEEEPPAEGVPVGSAYVDGMAVELVSDTVEVADTGVNLRTGPGTTYEIADSLPRGTELVRTGTVNGWSQVQYNGEEYYVATNLVNVMETPVKEEEEPGTEAEAAETPEATQAPETKPGDTETGTSESIGTLVVTSDVNIRSGPGTDYEKIGEAKTGATLTVVGVSADGKWYRVSSEGKEGYVNRKLVSVELTSDTADVSGVLTVTGDANIRSGPGTNYDILGQAKTGDQFKVTGHTASNWYKISYDGGTAYIAGNYASVNG